MSHLAEVIYLPLPTPYPHKLGELRLDNNGQLWAKSESHGWLNLTSEPGDDIECADDIDAPTCRKGL